MRHWLAMTFFKFLWSITTVLIPVAGAIVIAWAKDLNASARRRRALDEAIKRVEFWDSWLKATERLSQITSDDIDRAQDEVRDASKQVERLYNRVEFTENMTEESYVEYRRKQPIFKRIFLLYRQPDTKTYFLRRIFWLNFLYCTALIPLAFRRFELIRSYVPLGIKPEGWAVVTFTILVTCVGYWILTMRSQAHYFRNRKG